VAPGEVVRREYPQVPRYGGKVLAGLLVLAVLGLAADVGLRWWTEANLATSVRATLGLERTPALDVRGFPFLPQLLRGRFSRVEVDIATDEVEGLRVEEAHVDLRDVRRGQPAPEGGEAIRAGRVELQATVTDVALSRYLQARGAPVRVEFLGRDVRVSTRLEVAGQTSDAFAEGTLLLEGNVLSFDPEQVEVDGAIGVPPRALAFEVPLPAALEGITVDGLDVGRGTAVFRGAQRDATLVLRR
jgi:hypothetical protein